jgi:hypothetical protein
MDMLLEIKKNTQKDQWDLLAPAHNVIRKTTYKSWKQWDRMYVFFGNMNPHPKKIQSKFLGTLNLFWSKILRQL